MNIHITKEEFNEFLTIPNYGKFTVGSKLYGLNNSESDTDLMIITKPSLNQILSPFSNHHMFQYKDIENNIDYIITDIITFIKNLISGDSTINYELIHSEEFRKSELKYLNSINGLFKSYNIAKSYNGMIERDLKHFSKKKGSDQVSAMMHVLRGSYMMENIMSSKVINIEGIKNLYKYKLDLDYFKTFSETLEERRKTNKVYRQTIITKRLDDKQISRVMSISGQKLVNSWLFGILLKEDIENGTLPMLNENLLEKVFQTNEIVEFKYE